MNVLAMETSGLSGSVALCRDDTLLTESALSAGQRSAQSLAPTIRSALESIDWKAGDIELVAVTNGPGSFTGLRVGVVTAKTFAYSIGCSVIGVDTLEVIASQALTAGCSDVIAMIDAQRGDVFAARWRRNSNGEQVCVEPGRLVSFDGLIGSLQTGTTLTGPVLEKFRERLPASATVADRELWLPRATTVGLIGWQGWQAGRRDDVFSLSPMYVRRTAAEEQWEKRHGTDPA